MTKTVQLLDLVMKKHKLTSDYQLAKKLNISRQLVSSYRKGTTFSDFTCLKVAQLLGADELHIIALVKEGRASKPEEKEAWHKIVKKLNNVHEYILC